LRLYRLRRESSLRGAVRLHPCCRRLGGAMSAGKGAGMTHRVGSSAERPEVAGTQHLRLVVAALICCNAVCAPMLANPPAAHADDLVTYEVVSDAIQVANIEYEDTGGRGAKDGVTLPSRGDASGRAVPGAPHGGSQVRADWRPSARPARWVTVRIIYQGKVICQSTLDIGDAACYGITPRLT